MRTKNIDVTNIINAYAAVGTIKTISSNNCVATNTAKVPFCKPVSIKIVFFELFSILKMLHSKNAAIKTTTFKTSVINPLALKYPAIF